MIPLYDNIPARTVPVVNYALIILTSFVFLLQLAEPADAPLHERYGMIPARVFEPDRPVTIRHQEFQRQGRFIVPVERQKLLAEPAVPPWLTLLTCIFLHGGWLHFLGNMWFLHIFGDNVEDRLGHAGYLLFYLFCGVAASAAQLMAAPSSPIPTIGASGAIAGVMGSYLLLYPRAMVLTLIPLFVIFYTAVIPAPFFLGVWFLIQVLQGSMSSPDSPLGGVAWFAHIGGFVGGFAVTLFLKATGTARPPVERRRPGADHAGMHQWRHE